MYIDYLFCFVRRGNTRTIPRPPSSHTQTQTRRHKHTDTHTHAHIYIHTDTNTHTHTHTHTYPPRTHPHTQTHTHSYIHTYTQTHIHTHTHTLTYAHTHTSFFSLGFTNILALTGAACDCVHRSCWGAFASKSGSYGAQRVMLESARLAALARVWLSIPIPRGVNSCCLTPPVQPLHVAAVWVRAGAWGFDLARGPVAWRIFHITV